MSNVSTLHRLVSIKFNISLFNAVRTFELVSSVVVSRQQGFLVFEMAGPCALLSLSSLHEHLFVSMLIWQILIVAAKLKFDRIRNIDRNPTKYFFVINFTDSK